MKGAFQKFIRLPQPGIQILSYGKILKLLMRYQIWVYLQDSNEYIIALVMQSLADVRRSEAAERI